VRGVVKQGRGEGDTLRARRLSLGVVLIGENFHVRNGQRPHRRWVQESENGTREGGTDRF
jgi:hypothetical protein